MLISTVHLWATVPSIIDSQSVVVDLRTRLDKLFTSKSYRNSVVGAKVVSLRTGTILYERNSDRPLTPASTTKLFSTATLYALRGPRAELLTDVRADGKIDKAGVLNGNLYVVGCGDALLSTTDIDLLADQLQQRGISKVTGSIYGDASRFDDVVNRAVYSGDNEDVEPLPPITALSLQRGGVSVVVSATKSGLVNIQALPPSDGIEIINDVRVVSRRGKSKPAKKKTLSASKKSKSKPSTKNTKNSKGKGRADVFSPADHEYTDRVGDAPKRRRERTKRGKRSVRSVARISARSTSLAGGIQRITVSGAISPGTSSTSYVSFVNPAVATAGVLKHRLRTRGITIQGSVSEKPHPAASVSLAGIRRPLVDLASIVNKKSDNYLAEHVFKMCGAVSAASPSSAKASVQCVNRVLDSLNIPRVGCVINDGSGLSRRNLISAATQVALLQKVSSQPWSEEFKSTLAIAGVDGTIRKRFAGTIASNKVYAKTGTLRNVSALSGYVSTADGEPLVFSFISNGDNVSSYKSIEEQAAIILASFSWKGIPAIDLHTMPSISDEDSTE